VQVFSFHILALYLTLPLLHAARHSPLMSNALGAALVASLFGAAWWHANWSATRQWIADLARARLPLPGAERVTAAI
jgi:dsRNA-specific ribonuclease